ncbi:MAG: class I SAM-dependent methyltransferase [Acidimicrobiales bacterium]|nr:class I SAM-dependent methyltransferase [Acidimicrobiales bacterium]
MIPDQIVERLRCPECGRPVKDVGGDQGVQCIAGHGYPLRNGYLDCSAGSVPRGSTDRTFASFGFEWNNFDQVRVEDEGFAEVYFRDVDLTSLDGQCGLDAGCGKGRYTRFLAEHLGALAALDGSSAVEVASRNLAEFSTVLVVKSDLRTAPFAPESFDFIASLGVLHHLDDPRAGFNRLLTYLAPGGRILLYLYSRPSTLGLRAVALRMAAGLRAVTVRLPHRVLKVASAPIAALLFCGVVTPGAYGDRRGINALSRLPMNAYRGKPLRSLVLDTFDRLSAPVEHRYVWDDLGPWFEEAGLVVDAARDETGWFILAHRS